MNFEGIHFKKWEKMDATPFYANLKQRHIEDVHRDPMKRQRVAKRRDASGLATNPTKLTELNNSPTDRDI